MLDTIAGALALLGVDRALVVAGEDGLDEVSIAGPTRVVEVNGEELTRYRSPPRTWGCRAARRRARLRRRHARAERRGHPRDPRRASGPAARPRGHQCGRRRLCRRPGRLAGRRRERRRGGDRRRRAPPRVRALRARPATRTPRRASARASEPGRAPPDVLAARSWQARSREIDARAKRGERRRSVRSPSWASAVTRAAPWAAERRFGGALRRPGIGVIAEFKRRSPSAGEIRPGATVAEIVAAYERGGASGVSVLTEERHFGGSLEDLRAARAALPTCRSCARTSSSTPTSCTRRAPPAPTPCC